MSLLNRRPRIFSRTLRDQRGFTLAELLVIMSAGLVVFTALFAILDVTLRQTNRIVSQVDATQQARTTLEELENELHSSCVGGSVAPIQAGSSDTRLIFLSGYGRAASVTPTWHEITFTPGGASGTLTDSEYAVTNSGGTWVRSTLLRTQRLLGSVGRATEGSSTVPMFQYFGYDTPRNSSGTAYEDLSGYEYRMLLLDDDTTLPSNATLNGNPVALGTVPANSPSPFAVPLGSDASLAAAVLITLRVFPERGTDVNPNAYGSDAVISDLAVLRLTPVANHAGNPPVVPPCA